MVFKISQYVFPKQKSIGRPLLNEIYSNNGASQVTGLGIANHTQVKQQFWRWFRSRPELNSPVSGRVNDTIKSVDFYAPDGGPLGRNKRLEAEKFWRNNFMNKRLKSIWFDAVVTGSGFGWKGRISLDQLKEAVNKFVDVDKIEIKDVYEMTLRKEILHKAMDEDLTKTRVFDVVASSTTTINYDETSITSYTQRVGANDVEFSPQEIIHFPFECVDGRVEGYTPVESLVPELVLLWFIKENMSAYLRNGGLPRKVFSLPEELANSDNHKFLIQKLEDYGAVENRHGNLVFTGKLDIMELEDKLKDMEYKDLALYVTSNIAYALHYPISRIPYMIGASQSKGDASGMADSGYWSMIAADQETIENLMNTQCLEPLGFIMKFRKSYKMDDIREAQAFMTRADALSKVQALFNNYDKELTPDSVSEFLDLDSDMIQDIPQDRLQRKLDMQNPVDPTNRQTFGKNSDVGAEKDKLQKNQTKRNAATNNPSNSNQSGT